MSKVRDLPEITSLDDADLLYTVDVSEGPNGGKKITKANLKTSVLPTPAETKTLYESNADTNAFTDAEKSKLAGIESGAAADQNAAEVPLTPTGNISSTNVQDAVAELDAEKEPAFAKNTGFNKNFGTAAGTVAEGNDARFSNAQVIIVQKSPGAGQFSSIKAAVDSISDASSSKPYIIRIQPGVYVEDTITMKPFVFLIGSERGTVVQPDSPSKNIIIGTDSSSISNLILEGATATGVAAVLMEDGPAGGEFNVSECIFRSNYHFIKLDSSGGSAAVVVNHCEPGLNAQTVRAFEVIGIGEGFLRVNNFSGTFENPLLNATDLFHVTGANNRLILTNVNVIVDAGAITNGLRISDGAKVNINSLEFSNFGTGVLVENVGDAPSIIAACINLLLSTTLDLNVLHTGTIGAIAGAFRRANTFVDDLAPISVAAIDPDAAVGAFLTGSLVQGSTFSELLNLSDLTRKGITLGLTSGGEITHTGSFMISVAAGAGYIKNNSDVIREVSWGSTNFSVPSGNERYVTVNSSGVVQLEASISDITQRIVLGRVSADTSDIEFIEDSRISMIQHGNSIEDFFRRALGPIYESGSIVSENATPLALDVTAGAYSFGTERFQPSGGTNISWGAFYRNGVGGFNKIASQSLVSNTQYDDGSGTLASLTAGYYARHTLYVVGDGSKEEYFLIYSQDEYASLVEAEGADLPVVPTKIREGVVSVASIIVQQGNPNIVEFLDIRPTVAFRSGGVSASADHGNLLGLLDDDHPQYLRTDGSRVMTGSLDMGGFNVTNVNLVDGVDVSNHNARHRPGGADAIPTAAGITITDASNSEGSATTLARSDHTHAHGNRGGGTLHAAAVGGGSPANGFMSGADKVKLDRLDVGHLSYSNNSLQAFTSTTFVNVTLDSDKESFANSRFTKVSGTDFRADFTGQVKVEYSVDVYAAANNRQVEVGIQRNSTDLSWTARATTPRGASTGSYTVTGSFILNCSTNDVFRLRIRSIDGTQMTVPIEDAFMSVQVYRVA